MNHLMTAKMAWRNLVKNKRRTLITFLGIAFGVMLCIIFTGLQDATWGQTINMSARMGFGHITVQNKLYMDEPAVSNFVPKSDEILQTLKAQPEISAVKERVVSHAMVATAAQSKGAMIYGIDVSAESTDTFELLSGDIDGEFPAVDDTDGIVIGSELAKQLDVTLGKKVVYTMTDKNGEIVSALGRVRGILHTGSKGLDSTICLTNIQSLRALLGMMPEESTHLAVFIDDHRDSRRLAAALQSKKFVPGQVNILPWQLINPDLDGLVATKMGASRVFEILILFLVAAGIFNTLYVSVMERMREFGILNAIGFSGGRIFLLVVFESLFTAIGGLLMAALVSAAPYYYLNTHGINFAEMAANGKEMTVNGIGMVTTLYVDIYFEQLLAILAVAVFATMLSGLYPAYRASKVVPVESIKLV